MQAFMVGDRVDVHSRSAKGGDATIWSSDGSGQFTVKTVPAEVCTSFCYCVISFWFSMRYTFSNA
jgi:HSP90 family molecular chaperone